MALLMCSACGASMSPDAGTGGGFAFTGGGSGSTGGSSGTGGGSAQAGGGSSQSGGGSSQTGGGSASQCPTQSAPPVLDTLTEELRRFSTSGSAEPVGFVDPGSRILAAWPTTLSGNLKTLTVVQLHDAGVTITDGGIEGWVRHLPVSGTPPVGTVRATGFDPISRKSIAAVATRDAGLTIATLSVSDGTARFEIFSQTNPLTGTQHNYPTFIGGTVGEFGVSAGNDFTTVTTSGSAATWGTWANAQTYAPNFTLDLGAQRVLSVGGYTNAQPIEWTATIAERPMTSPTWAPIAMSGMGPANRSINAPVPVLFSVFDPVGNRLLIDDTRPDTIGGIPVMLPIVREANLTTHQWSVLRDRPSAQLSSAPLALDPTGRQFFTQDLSAWSMKPGQEFDSHQLKLSGAVNLGQLQAATRVPDGRVIAAGTNAFWVFDTTTLHWEQFGKQAVPGTASSHPSLSFDPIGNRLLLFGGQSGASAASELWALALDGSTLTKLTTSGTAPAGRRYHGAVVMAGQLVIAGGVNGTDALVDVWAFDLQTLAWRKLGDSAPRMSPGVIAHGSEVWVVGGLHAFSGGGEATIDAFTLSSGAKRSITVTGTWPGGVGSVGSFRVWAPWGAGLAALDVGSVIDMGGDQLFELIVTGDTAHWQRSDPNAMDNDLDDLVGVSGTGCDEALFVGNTSFRLHR